MAGSFVLATTDDKVRWYAYEYNLGSDIQEGAYEIIGELDLSRVPQLGNRDTAKHAAKALGLSSWRYVKLNA